MRFSRTTGGLAMAAHRKAKTKRRPPQDPTTAADADCLSVAEFCRRNGISKPFFYKLRDKGQGLTPEEFRLGSRVLITREAAEKWRRERVRASKRVTTESEITTNTA